MRSLAKYGLLGSMFLLPLAGQVTFDFSTPVVLSPTQAPGTWYPDRFAPHGFISPVNAPDGSINALKESIAAADHQTYPGNAFSNTQGRKFDLPVGTTSVTIKLYVPQAWATLNGRAAGFWATAFEADLTTVGDFPIIEFQGPTTSDQMGPSYQPNGGKAGFYGWNNVTSSFEFIGLPPGFLYNSWVQLTMTLVPGNYFVYTVNSGPGQDSVSITSPLSDAADTNLGNVILQGYNYAKDYDIFWGGGPVGTLINNLDLYYYWFFAA